MKRLLILVVVLGMSTGGLAQELEQWVEQAPYPEDLQAWLDELRQSPLDLNQASAAEIAALPFWDEAGAKSLIATRDSKGGFADLGEVMALSPWTVAQRQALWEFASVGSDPPRTRTRAWISGGCSDFTHLTVPGEAYGKCRAVFRAPNGQSGFVALRRTASDASLFDESSVGVQLRPGTVVSDLSIGDFQCEAGTGLVFASSYGMANWLSSPDARAPKEAQGVSLRPSSDRTSVFRGAAVEAQGSGLRATILGSWQRLDAALSDSGATQLTEGGTASPELSLARRDQVAERLIGLNLQAERTWWQAGITGYNAHYSPNFHPIVTGTSLPEFSGSSLNTGSLFLRLHNAGADAVAEWAGSSPGGRAFQGAVSVADYRGGLTAYYVRADADFYSPHSKLWGGFGGGAVNASSAGARLFTRWNRQAVSCGWSSDATPMPTATSSLSRHASEIEARWETTLADPLDISMQMRRTWSDLTSLTRATGTQRTDRGRLDLVWRTEEEYRVCFEARTSQTPADSRHGLGTLLFMQTRAHVAAIYVSARMTVFNLDDDPTGTPLQISDGALTGMYPLVALYGSGRRAALTVSRTWHDVTVSLQGAQTASRTGGQDKSALELACGLSYRR